MSRLFALSLLLTSLFVVLSDEARAEDYSEFTLTGRHIFAPQIEQRQDAAQRLMDQADRTRDPYRARQLLLRAQAELQASRRIAENTPYTYLRFVLIPPGEFWMGSPASEADRDTDEVQHHVRLTQAFYLSAYEVTNAQYKLYDGAHTSTADGDRLPVTEVSHDEAVAFAAWLSSQTGDTYALPTEAQWEYACRAGTTTPFSFGENINPSQVNHNGSGPYNGAPAGLYRATTTEVGSFPTNAWGLYDMHGNVVEWCADWYGAYSGNLTSATTDPSIPTDPGSGFRVFRGGSWSGFAKLARSAERDGYLPTFHNDSVGFRLARPVAP